ncbi:hypothetical protein [Donghicola eburneus]|uniref:hypothetical protein n=1 Tax=Donghicola eburneus TaxID=393278 RepID=UPI000934D7B4|nr:hypothetical protein [Donghicola eburneus]
MAAPRPSKHLKSEQIAWITDWILNQPSVPSLADICEALLSRFAIQRSPDSIRHRPEIKRALTARREAEKSGRTSTAPRLTSRRMAQLEQKIVRLSAEVLDLQEQRDALIESNLRMTNAMKAHGIPARQMERPLAPVNRDRTELPKRNKP